MCDQRIDDHWALYLTAFIYSLSMSAIFFVINAWRIVAVSIPKGWQFADAQFVTLCVLQTAGFFRCVAAQ